ncbi:hypothetical protein [Prosthecobacter sp.]|uniref:hypothetical protein n=1 Tax=Prosthecobacter sp. TaxID=1965333 RepID=UPI0037852D12
MPWYYAWTTPAAASFYKFESTVMNAHATNLECSHVCAWRDTCQCLRLLVRQSVLLGGHLGGAQLSGVESLYYPHGLPPCVRADGSLRWDSSEEDSEQLLRWTNDGPGL